MKKKILALCLVVVLAVTAVTGATLAYFTDTDAQKNVFVTGDVKIDLFEDFGDHDGIEKLVPATGSAQAGTLKNGIEKEVYVENTGSENAYVRVHIAVPAILDDGDPNFNASANTLHWNFAKESYGNRKWNWTKTTGGTGYDAANWNFYTENINGIDYNVYVATYETMLKNGEVTVDAIHQVYMDSKTTNENIEGIKKVLGDKWYIHVAAEGAQVEGFANAYEALNTSFGVPGSYKVNWNDAQGKKFAEMTSVKGK